MLERGGFNPTAQNVPGSCAKTLAGIPRFLADRGFHTLITQGHPSPDLGWPYGCGRLEPGSLRSSVISTRYSTSVLEQSCKDGPAKSSQRPTKARCTCLTTGTRGQRSSPSCRAGVQWGMRSRREPLPCVGQHAGTPMAPAAQHQPVHFGDLGWQHGEVAGFDQWV